jgi:hypothetical protein
MLKVQEFLQSGKTLDDLTAELGIKATHHPSLDLVILNYDQIDSPKINPLVRECRALTLDKRDWSCVSPILPQIFQLGRGGR